jgi:hypothetical protein
MLSLHAATYAAALEVLAILWPLSDHQPELAACFGALVFGAAVVVVWRYLRLAVVATNDGVEVVNVIRRYRIDWRDIREVRYSRNSFAIHGYIPVIVFRLEGRSVRAQAAPVSDEARHHALAELRKLAPTPVGFPDIERPRRARKLFFRRGRTANSGEPNG